jgi:CubicO group peptidase (beta-lactamase class C family)
MGNNMFLRKLQSFFSILIVLLLFISCANSPTSNIQEPEPPWTSNEWQEATPASQGIDVLKLNELSGAISREELGKIQSLIIIRNGKLIYEKYYRGNNRESLNQLNSATKSFTSALIGIAIEKGYVNSIDDKVLDYFPEHPYESLANPSEYKKDMTIENFLSMSAGFYSTENDYAGSDPRNTTTQIINSPAPYKATLDMPVEAPPGIRFLYNSTLTFTLGGIINKKAPNGMEEFAVNNLFEPLGITEYHWVRSVNGDLASDNGLYLKPRDMAKLGQLYLDGGVWRGKQVITYNWAEQSMQEQVGTHFWNIRYGYQWWLKSFRRDNSNTNYFPMAVGGSGQYICLLREFNMVINVTSTPGNPSGIEFDQLIEDYIFPAIVW